MDGKQNGTSVSKNAKMLRKLLFGLVKDAILSDLKRHGNCNWNADLLVVQVVMWAMSSESNVTSAHDDAKKNSEQLFGDVAAQSYQAMMNILERYSVPLMAKLQAQLRSQIATEPQSRIGGYFALAVDGSKPSAPRTRSNEKRFISPQYGNGKNAKNRKRKLLNKKKLKKNSKKKGREERQIRTSQPTPNVLITNIWNMGLQLPWHWTVGGSETDERQEVAQAVETLEFPDETLIVADAGFVGYELWKAMLKAKLKFLIRAGSNVYLKPKDRKKGLYYYRPNRFAGQPPIVVRLVYIKIGRTKMAMLTNELDPTRLPKSLIRRFYEMRWGVEVDFRDFKQTFDCEKFRCKRSDRVIIEADWSMLAFTLIKLWTHRHLAKQRKDQRRVSFALALKAFRNALKNHNNISPPDQTLFQELREAILDNYKRNRPKAARYQPVGEKPKTGLPIIQTISQAQKKALEDSLKLAL